MLFSRLQVNLHRLQAALNPPRPQVPRAHQVYVQITISIDANLLDFK
jgi:hypothetical protein